METLEKQMHSRAMILQKASSEFGIFWIKRSVKIYEDSYRTWNIIDRFWIEAFCEGLPAKEGHRKWLEKDMESSVQALGDELARLISEYDLTYAEISSVLMSVRSSDIKSHIRTERHLGDPSMPGGLA